MRDNSSISSLSENRPDAGRSGMIALQLVLLAVIVLVPGYYAFVREAKPQLPVVNNVSVDVRPTRDDPGMVSDEQLLRTLERLRPRFNQSRPKVNHVDHALRFWGLDAEFASSDFLSGDQMRKILTDHSTFRKAWGQRARPLMVSENHGVSVRTALGPATTSHVDHLLASLAEIGTPLDYPLQGAFGESSVNELLRNALRSFSLNQQEYEWTSLALALYAADGKPWYTTEGQKITFDALAKRLMRQSFSQGVCYGNHRLYTLAIILRVDESKDLLSEEARLQVLDHLFEATQRLVSNQHTSGYWDETWAGDAEHLDASDQEKVVGRRILATGHALEWWAIAPAELLPPRDVLVRASQWIVQTVEGLTEEQISKNYTFLSHAGRALALWRKQTPAEFYNKQKEPTGANP